MFKKRVNTCFGLALVIGVSGACSTAKKPPSPQTHELRIEEKAPPPEPPYPDSESGSFAADVSMLETEERVATLRPLAVDDDGAYYYGTRVEKPAPKGHHDIVQPERTYVGGDFRYKKDNRPAVPLEHPGIEAPIATTTRGEYHYRIDTEPATASASLKFGVLTPPNLVNRQNGATFEQLYSNSQVPLILVDYEWRVFSSLGRLSLKIASGVAMANGRGRFRNAHPDRIATVEPIESFMFVLFPNQLTASYKFQFAERQFLVPYVEGGGGYFTFTEVRDDFRRIRFGASPVGIVAGGANILLDWFDPSAVRELDASYGINHVWLTAELRQIVGLKNDLDLSSTSINGGVLLEF